MSIFRKKSFKQNQPKADKKVGKKAQSQEKTKSFPITLHRLDKLEWIAIVLSLWLLFFPHPYTILFGVVLALPIVGLIINGLRRPSLSSLVSINPDSEKNKYDLADFIDFPAIGLFVRVLRDYEFESFYSVIKVGTIGFILLLILLFMTHKLVEKSNKNRSMIYLTIIANVALYSYAGTYGVNCVFDDSDPIVYEAKVVDKHISRSRRSTTYYIRVEPWGHHRDRENIKVAGSQYYSIEPGQTVQIDYMQGLLGIPWYFIE